jgi:ASC-1-like (ASCH) protein
MARILIKIREVDRNIFEAIKTGRKAIETRATTPISLFAAR